ncbi:MAG: hypothetical protein IJI68_05245 [Eggerthellaceae bacterium]|nr:hypothetical protein [Eggerthellaceae bacterium]
MLLSFTEEETEYLDRTTHRLQAVEDAPDYVKVSIETKNRSVFDFARRFEGRLMRRWMDSRKSHFIEGGWAILNHGGDVIGLKENAPNELKDQFENYKRDLMMLTKRFQEIASS